MGKISFPVPQTFDRGEALPVDTSNPQIVLRPNLNDLAGQKTTLAQLETAFEEDEEACKTRRQIQEGMDFDIRVPTRLPKDKFGNYHKLTVKFKYFGEVVEKQLQGLFN